MTNNNTDRARGADGPTLSAQEPPELDSAEALLPWYATGKLAPELARDIEAQLQNRPGLQQHLRRVEEERDETIRAAEAVDVPSRRMAEKFNASLEKAGRKPNLRANPLWSWVEAVGTYLAGLRPQMLGMAATGAAIAIVALGGTLATRNSPRGPFVVASSPALEGEGTFLLVTFQPDAQLKEIEEMVISTQSSIVDGPRAGVFKLRIGPANMKAEDRAAKIEKWSASKRIVRTLMPAQ